jgi:GDP-L-fucose synthase
MLAEDLAKYIWKLVKNIDAVPEVMNVGLGFDFSINEYYRAISKVIGYKGGFTHDLSKPVGMRKKLVDIHKMNGYRELNSTPLADGIKITYKYYLNTYEH